MFGSHSATAPAWTPMRVLSLCLLATPSLANSWVDVWATMPQLTEPANLPSGIYNNTPKFFNTTLRQTVKLDLPAQSTNSTTRSIRLRITNAFGTTPLEVTAVTIARPYNNLAGTNAIIDGTLQTLTFDQGANTGTVVPTAALTVTDPIDFDFSGILTYVGNGTTQAGSILSVSIYLADGQLGNAITSHPGSRTTSYLATGDQVDALNVTGADLQSLAHWYFIEAIESYEPAASTMALIGDSITDGRGTVTDGNNRWADFLFTRMQNSNDSTVKSVTLSNEAAGGNCVLSDCLGPSVLARLDRDYLAQSGIRYGLVFNGVNDIGSAAADNETQVAIGEALIAGYRQIIARSHAQNLPIFGCTITPFGAPNSTDQAYSDDAGIRAQTRQTVNEWIRNSGEFDAVVDFDAAVRDPNNPAQLNPAYNFGDYLHLNPSGYLAMANSFPLGIFEQFANGVGGANVKQTRKAKRHY